jgi:DNA mismatch repair protein MutL
VAIRVLEDKLINKIAAGEVVDRPAAIVKEMIENSVDAGATKILVRIANAGLGRIEVEDNGRGMAFDEVPTAFLRHATSKIVTEDDLNRIQTMGFRGEALPSIASVSRMEIYTMKADDIGVYAQIEGGRIIELKPHPCSFGTKIIVTDLFYNTPVRKKFLKSPVTEGNYIYNIICWYALSYPGISFSFQNDQRKFFKTPGNGSLIDVVRTIYGHDFAAQLQPLSYDGPEYSLHGLISIPKFTRVNRKHQMFFVNGRPIRSPLLYKAVDSGYRGVLVSREHPVVILSLNAPLDSIDVNIHPQKREVRFRDEPVVFRVVEQAIRKQLSGTDYGFRIEGNGDYQHFTMEKLGFAEESAVTIRPTLHTHPGPFEEVINEEVPYKVIGQHFNSYIITEKEHDIWLIDQHAAAERIIYNRLINAGESNDEIQSYLLSLPLELSSSQVDLLAKHKDALAGLGFEIDILGFNSVIIRGIPKVFSGQELEVVLKIADRLAEKEDLDIKHEAYSMAACQKAVKANQRLTIMEMEAIVRDLFNTENYKYCPHGRPTMVKISRNDIEKMFKRS